MTFEIDRDACIGCGLCKSICPKSFIIENGVAKTVSREDKTCDPDEVIENCPCKAIKIKTKS